MSFFYQLFRKKNPLLIWRFRYIKIKLLPCGDKKKQPKVNECSSVANYRTAMIFFLQNSQESRETKSTIECLLCMHSLRNDRLHCMLPSSIECLLCILTLPKPLYTWKLSFVDQEAWQNKSTTVHDNALIPFECQQLLWFISFWERRRQK